MPEAKSGICQMLCSFFAMRIIQNTEILREILRGRGMRNNGYNWLLEGSGGGDGVCGSGQWFYLSFYGLLTCLASLIGDQSPPYRLQKKLPPSPQARQADTCVMRHSHQTDYLSGIFSSIGGSLERQMQGGFFFRCPRLGVFFRRRSNSVILTLNV